MCAHAESMTPAISRLDPTYPLCWEDPHTLRLGFDRALARIPHPTAAAQRLLAALQRGMPTGGMTQAVERTGVTPAERHTLLAQLAPLLVTEHVALPNPQLSAAAPEPLFRVAICGNDVAAPRIHAAIERANWQASVCTSAQITGQPLPQARPDVCIVIERFLEPPATFQSLTNHDLPHLSIRFTDRSIFVGPLVLPDQAPCMTCVQLADATIDPGIPVLAAQLLGTQPAAQTPASVEHAAALALTFLQHWRAGKTWPHATRLRTTVSEGLPHPVPDQHTVTKHSACACA